MGTPYCRAYLPDWKDEEEEKQGETRVQAVINHNNAAITLPTQVAHLYMHLTLTGKQCSMSRQPRRIT